MPAVFLSQKLTELAFVGKKETLTFPELDVIVAIIVIGYIIRGSAP
jgi:hypothetical protein